MPKKTTKKAPAIRPTRRHTRYETHVKPILDRVEGWARMGYPDKVIIGALGISAPVFQEWKKKHKEFADALALKEIADIEVEACLFKRATGYTTTEVHYEEGTQGVKTKTITKQIEPNVTAQIYWLKNRKPDQWRDKTEVEQTGDVVLKFDKDDEKV